jgi:hypothetical protein
LSDPARCPVCRARFAGVATCTRCGADLTKIMLLLAESHRLREEARGALRRSELELALGYVREAQALAASEVGARLEAVIGWWSSASHGGV